MTETRRPGLQDDPEDPPNSQEQEVDESFRALLEGLRTSMPGVQVLFGFLLVLPFQSTFVETSTMAQTAYSIAFYSSALAALLFAGPSVHQWLRAPKTGLRRRHHSHVMAAVRLAIAGSLFFLVALISAVFLVSRVVYQTDVAATAVAILAVVALWVWFYLPLVLFDRWK